MNTRPGARLYLLIVRYYYVPIINQNQSLLFLCDTKVNVFRINETYLLVSLKIWYNLQKNNYLKNIFVFLIFVTKIIWGSAYFWKLWHQTKQ